MRDAFARILSRHGQSAQVTAPAGDGSEEIRLFIQPILRQKEEGPARATPLGAVSRRRWLCLAGRPLSPGDHIRWRERTLVVQDARAVFLKDSLVYCWAILRGEKEAAQ